MLSSWRSLKKIAGSVSVCQRYRYRSADPDPSQNVTKQLVFFSQREKKLFSKLSRVQLKQQDPYPATRMYAVPIWTTRKNHVQWIPVPPAGGQAHVPRHFPVHIAGEVGHSAQCRAPALGTPGVRFTSSKRCCNSEIWESSINIKNVRKSQQLKQIPYTPEPISKQNKAVGGLKGRRGETVLSTTPLFRV